MAWQIPKVNWGQPGQTVVGADDVNRIEENIRIVGRYDRAPGYGVASGINAKTISLDPAPESLYDGLCFAFRNTAENTGAVTINPNGLGAIPVKMPNGIDIPAGYFKVNGIYTVRYSAAAGNFFVQGSDSVGDATPEDVTAGKTFSNDNGPGKVGTMPVLGDQSTELVIDGPNVPQIIIPAGRLLVPSTIVARIDPSKASIIKLGETLGGVTGALKPFARESGTVSISYSGSEFTPSSVTVSGLPFAPETIIIEMLNDYWFSRGGYAYGHFVRADLYFGPGTTVKSMRYNDDSYWPRTFTVSISRGPDGFTMSFSVSAASYESTLNLRWTAMSY